MARGLQPDGQLVFYAWGRRDLGQYLTDSHPDDSAEATPADSAAPVLLRALPRGHHLTEVWCGSEFTLASDEAGGLWGCGWNEHGNLGNGDSACRNVTGEWQPVLRYRGTTEKESCNGTEESADQQVLLSSVWEGALACGGGHVIGIM